MNDQLPIMKELEQVLNKYCEENKSNTPDFIIASYLVGCLDAFNLAVNDRDRWYGVHLEPGNKYFESAPNDTSAF